MRGKVRCPAAARWTRTMQLNRRYQSAPGGLVRQARREIRWGFRGSKDSTRGNAGILRIQSPRPIPPVSSAFARFASFAVKGLWWLGLWVAVLLAGTGCEYRVPEVAKLPVRIEIENPGHLRVAVINPSKRALAPSELGPFQRAGSRWDYTVQFTDTTGVGVQFREVQATVRSLAGVATTRTIPLASRVEAEGTTPIYIDATLSTSNPEEPGNLTGVQELVFLGQDDRGAPVRLIVRVPLE